MRFDTAIHSQINPDPNNVRQHIKKGALESLADSIKQYGLLENLVVRETPNGLIIVAGERRWLAIGYLIANGDWLIDTPIHVCVIESNGTFENIVENLCREEVPAWELGRAFSNIVEAGHTQMEIGARIGKNQGYVSRLINISQGLHPAAVDRLNSIRSKFTIGELSKISALLNADKKPDEQSQIEMIEKLSGLRKTRKRKRSTRTDAQRIQRRLVHLRDNARVPSHALPYVEPVVNYLLGLTRTVKYPEEF
jgi:ParB family chromosome partitioning protein